MRKLAAASLIGILLTGCGTVGNVITQEQTLQRKAAFALNTTPDRVTISNRVGDIESINFVATVGKESHQCYVATLVGISTSDAVCSGSNSVSKQGTQCNALLRAAGRC